MRSVPKTDECGKHHNRPNKVPLDLAQSVHDLINEYAKYVSHYSRKENPNRVYLNYDTTISVLYKDFYLDWCRKKTLTHSERASFTEF